MQLILLLAASTLVNGVQQPPHMILIVGDDMGSNDIGYSDPFLHTPHMDSLANDGIKFSSMYTWRWCAPSRGSLLSGRYAPNHGYETGGDGPDSKGRVYGLPTEFELLPAVLSKQANYATHMVGKWHLGFGTEAHLPTNRGFDTFLGYLTGAEDYYTHEKDVVDDCPTLDFWNGTSGGAQGPAAIDRTNSTYSTDTFTERIVSTIAAHPNTSSPAHNGNVPPLFIYAAFQGIHTPLEVPKRFFDRVATENCSWDLYQQKGGKGFKCELEGETVQGQNCFCNRLVVKAQMMSLDEAVQDIKEALEARGLYDDSVIMVLGDNGGPTFEAHSNSPLRGGKFNSFEGGLRPAAFLHASKKLLPDNNSTLRGTWYNGSLHQTDIFATFVALANGTAGNPTSAPPVFNGFAIDGVNMWSALLDGAREGPPVRTEVLLGDHILRQDNYKLVAEWTDLKAHDFKSGMLRDCILGTNGGWLDPPTLADGPVQNLCPMDVYTKDEEKHYPDDICCNETDAPGCHPVTSDMDKQLCINTCTTDHPCLYDLANDPQERTDVAHAHPDVVDKMLKRLKEIQKGFYDPDKAILQDNGKFCKWVKHRGGFLGPWLDGSPPVSESD